MGHALIVGHLRAMVSREGEGRRPLSIDYRRGQFLWLAAAAHHPISLGLPGIADVTVTRL